MRLNHSAKLNIEKEHTLQVETKQENIQEKQSENINVMCEKMYTLENINVHDYLNPNFSEKYGNLYLSSRFDTLLINCHQIMVYIYKLMKMILLYYNESHDKSDNEIQYYDYIKKISSVTKYILGFKINTTDPINIINFTDNSQKQYRHY